MPRVTSEEFTWTKTELIEWVKKATEDFKRSHFRNDTSKKPENIRRIENLLSQQESSSYVNLTAAVVSELTGYNLTLSQKEMDAYPFGVMVVPLVPGYGYPVGEPVFCYKEYSRGFDLGMNWQGIRGNQLPSSKARVRPATPEEIDTYFSKITWDCTLIGGHLYSNNVYQLMRGATSRD